jgi:hypothetical protein
VQAKDPQEYQKRKGMKKRPTGVVPRQSHFMGREDMAYNLLGRKL